MFRLCVHKSGITLDMNMLVSHRDCLDVVFGTDLFCLTVLGCACCLAVYCGGGSMCIVHDVCPHHRVALHDVCMHSMFSRNGAYMSRGHT